MVEYYETQTNKSFIYDLKGNSSVVILLTTEEPFNLEKLLLTTLGEKRKDTISVVFLTVVYTAIFLTGVIGNLSTCLVIWKNPYMHTVTNYYLFNLAISDVLTLLLGKFRYLIVSSSCFHFVIRTCTFEMYKNKNNSTISKFGRCKRIFF